MRKNDSFYRHLLHECQSADLQHRLEALEDLRRHEYLDLVEAQFLLDRLNSTSHWQEQTAILRLMSQIDHDLSAHGGGPYSGRGGSRGSP